MDDKKDLMKTILLNFENNREDDQIEDYDEQTVLDCKANLIKWGLAEGPKPIYNTEGSRFFAEGAFITGITKDGYDFLMGIEQTGKTEINYNMNIADNSGTAIVGNGNTVINAEFEEKFIHLIQAIDQSKIENKAKIIKELNERKTDKEQLLSYLGTLLTRGAEVATIVPVIGALIGAMGG